MICPSDLHQRNPSAPKFENSSQEETEWQEQRARKPAWKLAKKIIKLKEDKKQHSSHLRRRVPVCICEREGIVGGDEGPVGGVAQVVCQGVKVVGVHGEEGQEKDGEVREEVKGEVEQLREKRSSWMVCG